MLLPVGAGLARDKNNLISLAPHCLHREQALLPRSAK